jgi:hypothetical protein
MTFDEILDQALALLQRRGRLTYRALQRQFNLDEAYLADLRDEIIQGQRLYAKTGHPEPARVELSTAMTLYRAMDMTFWLPETTAMLAQVEG